MLSEQVNLVLASAFYNAFQKSRLVILADMSFNSMIGFVILVVTNQISSALTRVTIIPI